MRLACLALVLGLAACPSPDPAQGLSTAPSATLLDYNAFVCDALPTLVRRCSYSACHGNAIHAFRVYSPGKLRIGDPLARDGRDAPLTADEIQANYESAVGMTRSATDDQRAAGDLSSIPLLRKPLAARFGGDEHQGVGVFPAYPHTTLDDDPEWLLLVNWVAGARQPNPVEQRCRDFFDALGVSPR